MIRIIRDTILPNLAVIDPLVADIYLRQHNGPARRGSIVNNPNIIKYFEKKVFNTIKYKGSEYWLCSGLYVGRVSDLAYMFDVMDIDSDTDNDDQLLLTRFIINNPKFTNDKIALDTQMELFTNAARKKIKDWLIKDTTAARGPIVLPQINIRN